MGTWLELIWVNITSLEATGKAPFLFTWILIWEDMCLELQVATIEILRLRWNSLESWAKVRIFCLDSSALWVNKFPFFNLSAWIEFSAFLQKKNVPITCKLTKDSHTQFPLRKTGQVLFVCIPRAPITKYHKQGGLNDRGLFSHTVAG